MDHSDISAHGILVIIVLLFFASVIAEELFKAFRQIRKKEATRGTYGKIAVCVVIAVMMIHIGPIRFADDAISGIQDALSGVIEGSQGK